jgi:ubiquinone/menaquinone biosynthesis C-methylase UbiE
MQLKPDRSLKLRAASFRPAERLYYQRLLRRVRHLFPAPGRVLDAGCGAGNVAEVLAEWGCQVTGIDIECQDAAVKRLQQAGGVFCEASAEALPFPDAQFDAALVKDAFHHMKNPARALSELCRVVRPGGPIVVIEANRYNPVFYLHLTLCGEHDHFTRWGLRRFLAPAGPLAAYTMAESRCLPWDASWLLVCLNIGEEILERVRLCNPWLTYQIAVVKGLGKAVGQ